jgi:transcriptional regulator with XRE-family HTH domain
VKTDDFVVAEIADRCAQLREIHRLSLQEVADRAGFTKSHMWEFEQGRSSNPSIRMLLGLARAYGVSLEYIIGASTKMPPLDPEALRIAADIDRLLRKGADKKANGKAAVIALKRSER